MTAKRYIARDMSNALKKVREELGPDAIILSNKRVDKGVEIVAMLDDSEPSPAKNAKKRFAASFDAELDQPLESDTQWRDHHHAEQVAANTQVVAAKSAPSKAYASPNNKRPASVRPAPAQHTQETTEQSASRLAKEIQQAHERMLSAQADSFQAEPEPALTRASAPGQAQGQNRQLASFTQQVRDRGIDETDPNEATRLHSLYDEIAEMRMLLQERLWESRSAPAPANNNTSPRARQLAGQLQHLGLANDLVEDLLVCANDSERLPNCWRKALAMLAQRIPVAGSDPVEQGGTFAFVGPTGVGKTTTIAKLAARYVLNHGRGKVAIVTTDTYRVGAHDQLKALGRILQLPVRSIEGEHQLPAVLSALKQYPLVLIDTAGFRQGDPKRLEQERLLNSCTDVQRILVLAANSQAQVLKASLHAYAGGSSNRSALNGSHQNVSHHNTSHQNVSGAVLTKVDECISLGEALSALSLGQVPLAYVAAGQEIPDDIHVASAGDIVARAVKLARQAEGQFEAQQA